MGRLYLANGYKARNRGNFMNTSCKAEISACFVNDSRKIGYIGNAMRPHLRPSFPRLADILAIRIWFLLHGDLLRRGQIG